ncbi:MAG: hypothetical protein ABH821_00650 [archaeon]
MQKKNLFSKGTTMHGFLSDLGIILLAKRKKVEHQKKKDLLLEKLQREEIRIKNQIKKIHSERKNSFTEKRKEETVLTESQPQPQNLRALENYKKESYHNERMLRCQHKMLQIIDAFANGDRKKVEVFSTDLRNFRTNAIVLMSRQIKELTKRVGQKELVNAMSRDTLIKKLDSEIALIDRMLKVKDWLKEKVKL